MTIKDPVIVELVELQTKLFLEDGSQKDKEEVLKKIQKRQKQLLKGKKED